jgi:hypothetical protein
MVKVASSLENPAPSPFLKQSWLTQPCTALAHAAPLAGALRVFSTQSHWQASGPAPTIAQHTCSGEAALHGHVVEKETVERNRHRPPDVTEGGRIQRAHQRRQPCLQRWTMKRSAQHES